MTRLQFLITAMLGLLAMVLAPTAAWAQVSTAEIGAVQAAGAEIDGAGIRKSGRAVAGNADEQEEPAQEEAAAARPAGGGQAPGNAAAAFAQQAQALRFSISLVFKPILMFLVVLMWVRAGDWVNRDTQIYKLGWHKWNPIIFFPMALLTLLMFFLPLGAIIRTPILFVVFVATWIPYVLIHNKNVEPHETVLTGAWWRYVFASLGNMVGIKVSAERKAEYEKGAPVDLMAMGAEDNNTNNANLLSARHSPGYLLAKDLIVEMVKHRCERVLLDFTKQSVNVRHEIDGVWHNGDARDRESNDVMLAVLKTLANLNAKDRKSKQSGEFGAKYRNKSYTCPLVTQGVASGERVIVTLHGEKKSLFNYNDLGMREGLQQQWEELMASDHGLLVLSSLPGDGLTTITNISISETDRLMRDFVSIEDLNHPEEEIQNLKVTTYDAAAGETPATILPSLIRTYPNVYVCRDFVNVETAKLLLNEVRDERVVITNVRARESAEALLRLLQMKIPAKELASTSKAVLYQRLIRLLCPDCKVAYTPPGEVLRKLGIPSGKIEHLYRPPKGEEINKPCATCQGLGYKGRTGIFELLKVTDQMREILVKDPKLSLLKKAARAARQRSLQEEGILLVAKGITSVPELMRVLKQ
ncbi:MAG: Flp pilus assembly complex ATPase component TadA [Planctomycetales bacterium]|nr:Flp pilus assembly complex ATPase component TadA [Planctomycetales bacterium]